MNEPARDTYTSKMLTLSVEELKRGVALTSLSGMILGIMYNKLGCFLEGARPDA